MIKILYFIFILIFSFSSFAQDFEPKHKNAKAYIAFLKEEGGAGNGGNILVSEFFKEFLVGVEILKLSRKVSEIEIEKLKDFAKKSKVYPVEFQLCQDDSDSTCSDDVAYAAKNYPQKNIILLDGRDLTTKWRKLSLTQKRRLAVHEIAGLAGMEVANHILSTQIDSEEIFNDYKKSKDLNRYFKHLNDLHYMLPGSSPSYFIGDWGKKVVVRPQSLEYSKDQKELLRGEKYMFTIQMKVHYSPNEMGEITNDSDFTGDRDYFKDKKTGKYNYPSWWETQSSVPTWITDYSHYYKLKGRDGFSFITSSCFTGRIESGEFQCDWLYNPKTEPKWNGKLLKIFSPSFPTNRKGKAFSLFSCKSVNENQLMCRHVYKKELIYSGSGILKNVYEYAFFDRIKIAL
ncbi:MAG: hypothetical protein ACOYL6_08685 [Bacteriovoracaceae bacterium]